MNRILFFLSFIALFTNCQNKLYKDNYGIIKCNDEVEVGFIGELDGVSYKVVDNNLLYNMVKNNDDIARICTSKVTNMSSLFMKSEFMVYDISNWDVSNVTNMKGMFAYSNFVGDISNWDVGNVTNMNGMFASTIFNGDISNWDVSNVTNMSWMFAFSHFNNDISNWDVRNVTNMNMFRKSRLNTDISNWDVNNVKLFRDTFDGALIEDKYKPNFQ